MADVSITCRHCAARLYRERAAAARWRAVALFERRRAEAARQRRKRTKARLRAIEQTLSDKIHRLMLERKVLRERVDMISAVADFDRQARQRKRRLAATHQ